MNEEDVDFQKGLRYKLKGDYKSAEKTWLKAAEHGNVNSIHSLGLLFYEGLGFKKDYKKAISYWEVSGEKQHPKSLFNLGLLYYNVEGVSQDLKKAVNYFEQALKLGCNEAAQLVVLINKQLESQIFRNYIKATQNGVVRMDSANSPTDVDGLCTEGLTTCFCFIVMSNTKKKFSLINTATEADPKEIIKECLWAGDLCTIHIIQGSCNNTGHERFKSVLEGSIRNSPISITINYQSISSIMWSVRLSRAGEITLLNVPFIYGRSAPNSEYRNAINMMNICLFHSLDLQYDALGWTALPKLTSKAKDLITKCYFSENVAEAAAMSVMVDTYNKFHDSFEKEVKKYNQSGTELYQKNEFHKSIEEFSKGLEVCDLLMEGSCLNEISSLQYNIGSAFLKLEKWNEALSHLKLAREIKIKLNTENEQIEKIEQKISYVQTLLEQKPLNVSEVESGDPAEQVVAQPNNETLAKQKKEEGNLHTKQKNYNKAIKCYEDAIRYSPQMKEAWFNKGLAYQFLEKYEEALKSFDEAINIDPDYKKAIDNKNFVQAKLLIKDCKYQEAYKLLKKCPKTAKVEFATIQSSNAFKAEIFFGRVDLKLTEQGEIRVLQFGNGMQSGFMGLKQIYGKNVEEILKENLVSFRLPYIVADQAGAVPLNNFNKAAAFIKQHNIVEKTDIDFSKISNYSGIYCGQNFEPKIYSNVLTIGSNVSAAIIADDLLLTHQMFVETQLQKYRPLTKILPRKYSSNLHKQINKEMPSNVYMIRVPDVPRDEGIWFASKQELDNILKFLLEPNDIKAMELFCLYLRTNNKPQNLHKDLINLFMTWRSSNSRSCVVEAYVPSKPVTTSVGKSYDPSMRVAFFIIRDGSSLTFKPIGAYWQLPKETIEHADIRLRANFTMIAQEQNYLVVEESDLNIVYKQLSLILPAVFHNMFTFNFEAYRQQLINSTIDSEKSLAYYLTTRMANELGRQGYMAAALELLDGIEDQYHKPDKIYHERGMIYHSSGCYNKAVEQFSEGLRLCPAFSTYYRRGLAYYALGMLDKALDDLSEACKGTHDPHYHLAYTQIKLEKKLAHLGSKSSAPHLSVDLHGASVKTAKEVVAKTLKQVKEQQITQLTIVTGIGNHVNNDGSRGVLFKALPQWLKKSESSIDIKSIKTDMGAYEIKFNNSVDYIDLIKENLEKMFALLNKEQLEEFLTQLKQKSQQGDPSSKNILGFMYINGMKVPQDITKGLSLLVEVAERFVDAQVTLGEFFSSDGFPIKDYIKAKKWFLKAAEKNHPMAMFKLGSMYWLGSGVIKEDAKAIKYLTQAAEFEPLKQFEEIKPFLLDSNSVGYFLAEAHITQVSAAHSLGDIYFYGYGNEKKDLKLAEKFYLIAAKGNRVSTQVILAKQYFFGWGIEKDDNQAFFWFEKAALAGDAVAEYYMGHCRETGRGTVNNLEQAFMWYKKSAEHGDLDAQFNIAQGCLFGKFGEKDVTKGLAQLKILAEQDHANSLFVLGSIALTEEKSLLQENQIAIEYIARAAKLEQVDAQKLLARLYLNKNYFSPDKKQALHWLREAAKAKDAEALYQLAVVLASENDHVHTLESTDCLAESAQLGFMEAQLILGLMYLDGETVIQDPIKAIPLLEQAELQGSDKAQVVLGRLYSRRDGPVPTDYEKAFKYFQKAALQNNFDAQTGLSFFYSRGYGVKADQQKAIFYAEKAAQQGDVTAQMLMAEFLQKNEEDKNLSKIIHWLTLAAEQGEKRAQYALGLKHLHLCKTHETIENNDHKEDRDFGAGLYWLYQAALQGYNDAIDIFRKLILLEQQEYAVQSLSYILSYEYELRQGCSSFPNIEGLEEINFSKELPIENSQNAAKTVVQQCNDEKMFKMQPDQEVSRNYSEAVKQFQKVANKGNANAQAKLGYQYLNGSDGVPENYAKAVECFQKAADQGDASAQCNLAYMYLNGMGISQNYAKALELFQKAANQGNARGQGGLGSMYTTGRGIPQSDLKAIEWFQKAANQGDVAAQTALGKMYETGTGIPQNYNKAVEWYQKAANQGDDWGQYKLGDMYADGTGVLQNYTKAVEWYQKAANQGHAGAQNKLGTFYMNGQGVTKDYVKAIELFKKAATQGEINAQNFLGSMYISGENIPQDYTKAVEWLQKAAEQGHSYAQHNLAVMYANGTGISQSCINAIEWYQKAAEQGNTSSQCNLGYMYETGKGIAKDLIKSLEWFQKAADGGNDGAQYNLGWKYKTGTGVTQDYVKAAELFQKAAVQGNVFAQYNLGTMYDDGKGVAQDYTKAFEWYQKAANQGDADAQYNVGYMYYQGQGVAKNFAKAIEWFKKAASQGNEDAADLLNTIQNRMRPPAI